MAAPAASRGSATCDERERGDHVHLVDAGAARRAGSRRAAAAGSGRAARVVHEQVDALAGGLDERAAVPGSATSPGDRRHVREAVDGGVSASPSRASTTTRARACKRARRGRGRAREAPVTIATGIGAMMQLQVDLKSRPMAELLTIGEVGAAHRRRDLGAALLRGRGLIRSERTVGSGHHRFQRSVIRRVAFIVFAQRSG